MLSWLQQKGFTIVHTCYEADGFRQEINEEGQPVKVPNYIAKAWVLTHTDCPLLTAVYHDKIDTATLGCLFDYLVSDSVPEGSVLLDIVGTYFQGMAVPSLVHKAMGYYKPMAKKYVGFFPVLPPSTVIKAFMNTGITVISKLSWNEYDKVLMSATFSHDEIEEALEVAAAHACS